MSKFLIGTLQSRKGVVPCPSAVTYRPACRTDTHLSEALPPQELAPFQDG